MTAPSISTPMMLNLTLVTLALFYIYIILDRHESHPIVVSSSTPTKLNLGQRGLESERQDPLDLDVDDADAFGDVMESFLQEKPVMHTFFQHIDKAHHKRGSTLNQGSGMSDVGHSKLLSAWRQAWEDAGWETVILDLDDAKAFPDYSSIRDFLDTQDFGEYDELCFLRWFAMISAGGGWMSDYDVFPIKENIPESIMKSVGLPNDGEFTAYDNGGLAPSLLSGTKDEWERMAYGLIDMANSQQQGFYSDMLALDDYADSFQNAFVKEYAVAWRLSDMMKSRGNIDCRRVWDEYNMKQQYWAIHFSHWNIRDALDHHSISDGLGRDDRADIANDFLDQWQDQCVDDNYDLLLR